MEGTYKIYINGYDFGCAVNKVVITLKEKINNITIDEFKVMETKQVCNIEKSSYPIEIKTFKRKVIDAYLSNEDGIRVNGSSNHITLKLYVSPNEGNPLLFSMKTQLNTWSKPYYLNITSHKRKLEIAKEYTKRITVADSFQSDTFVSSDNIQYKYAYYPVESDILVVWLHGLGEGATLDSDPYITLLANKVTALADNFQNKLKAHILVPQCPTYWMDQDGKRSNFMDGRIVTDTHSFYIDSLNELIQYYKNKYNIKQIVLAGCSNGGYMTLVMGMNYPQQYKILVPICEAVPDCTISDYQINSLQSSSVFFIYSKDDDIVDPLKHEVPTIERLRKIGCDVHVSVSEHVIDKSGFMGIDNKPFQYSGHWSWIYFDNDDSYDESGLSVWDFIVESVKKGR